MAIQETHDFEIECDLCYKSDGSTQLAHSLDEIVRRVKDMGWIVLNKPRPFSELDLLCLCQGCRHVVWRATAPMGGGHDVDEFYSEDKAGSGIDEQAATEKQD